MTVGGVIVFYSFLTEWTLIYIKPFYTWGIIISFITKPSAYFLESILPIIGNTERAKHSLTKIIEPIKISKGLQGGIRVEFTYEGIGI